MKKITVAFILVLCMATCVFAAYTPAIRLEAPVTAKAGETVTVNVVAEITPTEEISGYCATLKWNPQQFSLVGTPVLVNNVLSNKLAQKTNTAKGISEMSAASMSQPLKVAKQGKITLAEQSFKLADNLKQGDSVKIGFTTDPKVSHCGTCYSIQNETKEFKIITGAVITIK